MAVWQAPALTLVRYLISLITTRRTLFNSIRVKLTPSFAMLTVKRCTFHGILSFQL